MRSRTLTTTRRRFKRKGRRGRRFLRPSRTLQPFQVARWLTTSKHIQIDTTASLGGQVIKLNSAFDPLGDASASYQPLGFEQYQALYKRYCVIGWRVSIEVISTDNTNPIVVGFTATTQSSLLTSWESYRELPATVQRAVTPDIDKTYIGMKGSVKKWLAPRSGKMLSIEELNALLTADPERLLYGHLYVHVIDGSADPAKVHLAFKMRQLVVFYDPVIPARSTQ